VKTHVFMNDFSGGQLPAEIRGSFPRDFPWIYDGWSSDQSEINIKEININNIHALRFYHSIPGHLHVMKREGGAVLG